MASNVSTTHTQTAPETTARLAALSIEELIQEALAELAHARLQRQSHPQRLQLWWLTETCSARGELESRAGDKVFKRAWELCQSREACERELGAALLGLVHEPAATDDISATHAAYNAYTPVAVERLLTMLEHETDTGTLCAIIHALHLRDDPRAYPSLLHLQSHADAPVRLALANALYGRNDEGAISSLITLTADRDPTVRDWACFTLGSHVDADTPAIRAALLARATDEDDDTRGEAITGLVRRNDPHCADVVGAALADDEQCGSLILEAARNLGDKRLYPVLLHIQQKCDHDASIDPYWLYVLNRAVEECQP